MPRNSPTAPKLGHSGLDTISTKIVLYADASVKLTDYATVILAVLAGSRSGCTPRGARRADAIAAPTVSKLLKQLQRADLVISTRGLHGGYQLARPAPRSVPRRFWMRSRDRWR